MNRQFSTPTVGTTPQAPRSVPAVPVRAAVVGIVLVFAGLLWTIVVAPPLLSLALAAAAATTWCVWLERHSAAAADRQP
jgi:hypothetical protein